MRQLQKVLWNKGVLLTPQHLQTQDRFLEDLIEFRLASLVFQPWGFSRLTIDQESLAGGTIALTEAAGIFPDGLGFDLPRSDAGPAPKPFAEHWHPDSESLDLYLAVPEYRPGARNVGAPGVDRNTRYVAEVVVRRDDNTGLAEKPLQIARKNLRFIAEGEPLEGSSVLPVARVVRTATGAFQLDARFVPPLLDIAASDYVMAMARRLVEILSAKSSALAAGRRQRSRSQAEFGAADVANFWLLYTVNTYLPEFRHLYETRRGHPAALFGALTALAGALTTFSTTIHPRALPEYEHTDLGGCLTRLDEIVRELLETVVPANHVALPLRPTEPSIYATAIDQDRYFGAPQMYLAVSAGIKADELLRKVPQLVKVSSAGQVDRLIKQALPGVSVRPVPEPPGSLPIKLDYQYFLVERSGPEWDAIRLARNLAVYVPSDFPDPRLELVVVLPQEER